MCGSLFPVVYVSLCYSVKKLIHYVLSLHGELIETCISILRANFYKNLLSIIEDEESVNR